MDIFSFGPELDNDAAQRPRQGLFPARWLIVAMIAGVLAPTMVAAETPDQLSCSAAARQWSAVENGGDVEAMRRVIRAIGPHCADVLGANQKLMTLERAEIREAQPVKRRARRALSATPVQSAAAQATVFAQENRQGVAAYNAGDYAKAVDLFKAAALGGDTNAESNLGNAYYNGDGVKQDYAQAMAWYRKSASHGNADAEDDIGNAYYDGSGVKQDYAQALIWYRMSASHGNDEAEDNIGNAYYSGNGVAKDYAQAMIWYRKAADKNNTDAEESLGAMYEQGVGVPLDMSQARYWIGKAAASGSASAKATLADIAQGTAVLGVAIDGNARISAVSPGSAAAKAGILAGDVVTAVDSQSVSTDLQVTKLIKSHSAGDAVEISLTRDGKPLKVTAVLGAEP